MRFAVPVHTLHFMADTSPRRFRNTFQLFGFPTQLRSGFGVFLLLLLLIYPAPLGFWVAGAMGIFTIIHELGHALAARRAGCTATISLDFMVAYAAYSTHRELNWRSKIAITLAGPILQIGTALIVLLALGVNPFSRNDIASSSAAAAIWWAGFALGLLNLVPLLPLDGGAIIATIAERISPRRGRAVVLHASFGVTIGICVVTIIFGAYGFLPLFVFMLMMQYQQIVRPTRMRSLVNNAELQATGDPQLDALIAEELINAREFNRALSFAREAYQLCPSFRNAFHAATCALELGKRSEATMWLGVAHQSQIAVNELRDALDSDPRFISLRDEPHVSREWFTHR